MYLRWRLSSAVCSEMLAGQGLEALDLEQRRTWGKLTACDCQRKSGIAKFGVKRTG